jgi:hypothetical protein
VAPRRSGAFRRACADGSRARESRTDDPLDHPPITSPNSSRTRKVPCPPTCTAWYNGPRGGGAHLLHQPNRIRAKKGGDMRVTCLSDVSAMLARIRCSKERDARLGRPSRLAISSSRFCRIGREPVRESGGANPIFSPDERAGELMEQTQFSPDERQEPAGEIAGANPIFSPGQRERGSMQQTQFSPPASARPDVTPKDMNPSQFPIRAARSRRVKFAKTNPIVHLRSKSNRAGAKRTHHGPHLSDRNIISNNNLRRTGCRRTRSDAPQTNPSKATHNPGHLSPQSSIFKPRSSILSPPLNVPRGTLMEHRRTLKTRSFAARPTAGRIRFRSRRD